MLSSTNDWTTSLTDWTIIPLKKDGYFKVLCQRYTKWTYKVNMTLKFLKRHIKSFFNQPLIFNKLKFIN